MFFAIFFQKIHIFLVKFDTKKCDPKMDFLNHFHSKYVYRIKFILAAQHKSVITTCSHYCQIGSLLMTFCVHSHVVHVLYNQVITRPYLSHSGTVVMHSNKQEQVTQAFIFEIWTIEVGIGVKNNFNSSVDLEIFVFFTYLNIFSITSI